MSTFCLTPSPTCKTLSSHRGTKPLSERGCEFYSTPTRTTE